MKPLASIRRTAPTLATLLLATASPLALAQGFDKINTTVTNVNTILVTISIAVVTIALATRYFALDEPNINAIAGDGRYALAQLSGPYDMVTIDAYKVPYIPWHLTTQEFFAEVNARLSESGVVAINVGGVPGDRRLIDAVGATLRTVFPTVHAIDVPGTLNTILVATKQPTTVGNLNANLARVGDGVDPLLREVLATAAANIAPIRTDGTVMTDDLAPIESISDSIVVRYLLEAGPSGLGTLGQ